ncbi:hypothetical protein GSY74_03095 [Sulfurovum sp. bin170]|uniref:hypothetical protein n=1 Tax=Sulfurovum sp. bin170 TaxID=2695268 RepID=UPI0013DECBCE|nr:hypothetical protein [Sulfurovum sp. bin170]NEW60259.1 hypothetical protein [Sulfurovum sp. bin170]
MPKERVEEIKTAIVKSDILSEDEKSQSMKHIEEWIVEDKAFGLMYDELLEVNEIFKEIFKELGFA